MDFQEARILTNDAWKAKARGIPHNSFLVATAFDPTNFTKSHEFEREVLLLRVVGPAPLPTEVEIIKAKIEYNQTTTKEHLHEPLHNLDPITLNEFQYGGLLCRIIGTFYETAEGLRLGSDIENYSSAARLKVYKPRAKALERIINHINPEIKKKMEDEAKKAGFEKTPSPIHIGSVRYTSTDRLHRSETEHKVPVNIQPADFFARRTAVFGMTRTGKSNTIKTTVASVAISALSGGVKVGQIIFDINGEYANANHQDDGSSIADLFADQCVRYRAVETPGFEDLRINFYEQPQEALNLIQQLFRDNPPPYSGQDLDTFLSASLAEPDKNEHSAHSRWERLKSVFHAILYKAGYKARNGFKITIQTPAHLLKQLDTDRIKEILGEVPNTKTLKVEPQVAVEWYEYLRDKHYESEKGLTSSSGDGKKWIDSTMEAFLNILAQKNSKGNFIGGYRAIVGYTPYHTPKRQKDVVKEILAHLKNGEIVILDLSAGPVEIRTVLSERIARAIFNDSFELMNKGKTPQNIVIYIEEAHNLIGKKDELTATWPRIAKEGAKAKIALVYSTQEPSSIHPNILANTENWFVTHLNNDDELKTLAKFYDFGDFKESLKKAQDVGFARIKTLSSPFVIPTQIEKFDPAKLKEKIRSISPQNGQKKPTTNYDQQRLF
jgi:hypothetical protein